MVTDTSPELQNLENNTKIIRSFGRIKSRKLSQRKHQLLNVDLENYLIENHIDYHHPKNRLEIGFGFGDFIYNQALQNPQFNYYGCEPHINGIAYLLSKIQEQPVANIKISNQDIRLIIDLFPDNFFETIYLLFADPWPKLKHFKRRLITLDFLENILAKKLATNGKIIIATDHDSYKTGVLSHILKSSIYSWSANNSSDWKNFPSDWTITKYQKKALAEGREPILIELIKQS